MGLESSKQTKLDIKEVITMAVNVWRPLEDMMSLREAMDHLFESSVVRPGRTAAADASAAALPVDLYETKDAVVIQARVPGVSPDELEVTATEETVTIQGKLASNALSEEAPQWQWYRRELWTGNFSRVVTLPTRVDLNKIEANFSHGLLTLHIPKAEEVKPKSIKITVK